MIESPLIQSIVEEAERRGLVKAIVRILQNRFGAAGPAIEPCLAQVKDEENLLCLGVQAARCTSLEEFENAFHKELSREPPAARRGGRRAWKPE